MNGVNVSSSIVDWGNGTYTFTYVVGVSDSSVTGVPMTLQLFDARWGVSSDVVSTVLGAGAVFVDTTPPLVSFNATPSCSPDDDSVTASVNQTLCVSCGSLSSEPFGCAMWLSASPSSPPQRYVASSVNNSIVVTVGPLAAGDRPRVVAWAEDTAGNVGPTASLSWEVDLRSPVTLWSPENPPAFTNRSSLLFSFGCSRTRCNFDFAFGSSARVRLGTASATAGGVTGASGVVDTVLSSLPPRFLTHPTAIVSVAAVVNGIVVPVDGGSGNTTVEVKVDGGAWTDVRLYGGAFDSATQTLSLSGLSDGVHSLQARTRVSEDAADPSLWTHVWIVDTESPNVTFALAPPPTSPSPQCTAMFVLVADEDDASFEVQWRAVNSSVGDDGSVNDSAWQQTEGSVVSLSSLSAAVPYVLHSRAVDRAGNVGAVSSWRWSSGGCPSIAPVATALTVESYAAGVAARAVMWSVTSASGVLPSEVQYRLNDGPWLRTSDRPILLRGLNATTQYRVDVRSAVPCGCEAVIPEQAWASDTWSTYESGPGRVGIVSAPTLSSNSLYGNFELNSTARDAWFEYSLDGGSFAGCSSRLRVGPLATGPHNVTVRSVDVNGTFRIDADVTYSWTVVSLSSSSLELNDLPDGSQSLTVWAVKGSVEEASPRTVRWVVDTVPPGVSAVLMMPPVTNASVATVNASCLGESFPALCMFCADVSVNDGVDTRSCSTSGTVAVGMAVDGVYEARVSAIDAAGNEGAATVVTWTRDTTLPNTSVVVDTALTSLYFVPLLSMAVTNVSTLVFSAASSEASGGLTVSLDGVSIGTGLMSGPIIAVNVPVDGVHIVVITAVDAAGNADATPIVMRLLVDTTTPSTSVILRPAAVSNASTAAVSWRASGEMAGMLSRFELSSVPPLTMLPSFVTPDDGGMASTASMTLAGIPSGAYMVTARAVDAVGHVDAVGATFSFVVDVDAPTSRLVHSLTPIVNRSVVAVGVNASDALSSVSAFARVNGGVWRSVTAPTLSLTLADGAHRIECRGVDAAGNVQLPPYDGVNVTVDTTAPDTSVSVAGSVRGSSLDAWLIGNTTVTLLLSSTEPAHFDVSVDGVSLPDHVRSSSLQLNLAAGRHVVAVTATDVAGNVDGSAAVVSVVVDVTAPPPPRFTLLHERGCFVLPASPVYVCNSSDAVVFDAGCNETGSIDTAPCFVEWRMDTVSVTGGSGCVVADAAVRADLVGGWARVNGSSALLKPSRDGQYRVWWRSADEAGNAGVADSMLLWLDTTPPSKEPAFVGTPPMTTFSTTMSLEVRVVGDASPGRLSFVYELTRGAVVEPLTTAALPEPTNSDAVQLLVGDLVADTSYSMRVWTQDQAGHRSVKAAVHSWTVAAAAPTVSILSRPSPVSASRHPLFVFSAVWGSGAAHQGVVPDASFRVWLTGVSVPHSPCDEPGAAPNCSSWCNGTRCQYSPRLDAPQSFALQVQAVLEGGVGDVVSVLWEYRRCRSDQFAVITGVDALECRSCPNGGECTPSSSSHVVTQQHIVAQAGYWASPSSDGSRFYRCLVTSACKTPSTLSSNVTSSAARAECSRGRTGVLCGVCERGFYASGNGCYACPLSQRPERQGMVAAVAALVLVVVVAGFRYRHALLAVVPISEAKILMSMAQIIAAADAGYDIPWPSTISQLLRGVRGTWLDISLFLFADCGGRQRDFLEQTLLMFVGFKWLLCVIGVAAMVEKHVVAWWAIAAPRVSAAVCTCARVLCCCRRSAVVSPGARNVGADALEPTTPAPTDTDDMADVRGGTGVLTRMVSTADVSVSPIISDGGSVSSALTPLSPVPLASDEALTPVPPASRRRRLSRWQRTSESRVMLFRATFVILFLAYPSISLRVLQTFVCTEVHGEHYLIADVSVRCFTPRWRAMAVYAGVMAAVYVVGLPLYILAILLRLWRGRAHARGLFGLGSESNQRMFGFLYVDYGPHAWWWEVEEHARRLLVSAVLAVRFSVVASPLMVAFGLLGSVVAHLMHAIVRPWGRGTGPYLPVLQHFSLGVTTAVYFLGTLLKLSGIDAESPSFRALSLFVVALVSASVFGGLVVLVYAFWSRCRAQTAAKATRSPAQHRPKQTRLRTVPKKLLPRGAVTLHRPPLTSKVCWCVSASDSRSVASVRGGGASYLY
jgi:hypothetical protein